MFTGIIETTGIIEAIKNAGSNKNFWIRSSISNQLKADESVSHNGVCLTIEEIKNKAHKVTAIEETLKKSALGFWKTGDKINLERSMLMNGRLDGHIVQGHTDTTAGCIKKTELEGSWQLRFEFPEIYAPFIIEKGSIALNGISFTVFDVGRNKFSVAIIPYTYQHTGIDQIENGSIVNIEFDVIGKYVQRILKLNA